MGRAVPIRETRGPIQPKPFAICSYENPACNSFRISSYKTKDLNHL